MVRETGVHSLAESYQRLKKWFLTPPCLTLRIIRNGSRVKLEQSRERSSVFTYTFGVVAIEKGAFGSPSISAANFTYIPLIHTNTLKYIHNSCNLYMYKEIFTSVLIDFLAIVSISIMRQALNNRRKNWKQSSSIFDSCVACRSAQSCTRNTCIHTCM